MASVVLCPQSVPSKPMRRTRRRRSFFSEGERLRVINRVKNGENIQDLAAELEVKVSTIENWLASERVLRYMAGHNGSMETSLEASSGEEEQLDHVPDRITYLQCFKRPIHDIFLRKEVDDESSADEDEEEDPQPKKFRPMCSSPETEQSEWNSSVGTSTPVKSQRADGDDDADLRDLSPIRGCSNEISKWILNTSETFDYDDGDSTGGPTLSISDLIRMEREALQEQ